MRGNNLNQNIIAAIDFAAKKHQNGFRKGSDIPYITHPLEVMTILIAERYPEEAIIAGLLHDVLEDTDCKPSEIEEAFGKNVLALVVFETDNKSLSWKMRKQATIDKLKKHGDSIANAVCFADKLANLRSIFRDREQVGEKVWERFNALKDEVLWYYQSIHDAATEFEYTAMFKEFGRLLKIITEPQI